MADEDEIAVVLESEPAADTIETTERARNPDGTFAPVAKASAEPVEDLADQFKALQRESEGNKHAREAAERRSQALEQEALRARQSEAQARQEIAGSQYESVTSGIAAADSEASAAEQEYAKAYDAGDALAMAKAQRKLANAEARKVRLDEAKADIETRHQRAQEQEPQRRAQEQERRAPFVDPVEAFLGTRTEATRNWLKAHPDHARSLALHMYGGASKEESRRAQKILAADNDALAEGIERDTTEYFSHVEAYIAPKQAPEKVNGATQQVQPKRRSSVPVAPVQSSPGGTNGGGTEVRLTKGEYAAATDGVTHVWNYDDPSPQKRFKKGDAIGAEEFARRKLRMQREGRYDRSYTES